MAYTFSMSHACMTLRVLQAVPHVSKHTAQQPACSSRPARQPLHTDTHRTATTPTSHRHTQLAAAARRARACLPPSSCCPAAAQPTVCAPHGRQQPSTKSCAAAAATLTAAAVQGSSLHLSRLTQRGMNTATTLTDVAACTCPAWHLAQCRGSAALTPAAV